MISNLETERDKLIQIILAGQPEFNDMLNRHDLRQLNQRITVRCRLTPMKLERYRRIISITVLKFPATVFRTVLQWGGQAYLSFSRGVPRLINVALRTGPGYGLDAGKPCL